MTASTVHELGLAQTMAARTLVEKEPSYAFVSARLLLNILRAEAIAFHSSVKRSDNAGRRSPLPMRNTFPSMCAVPSTWISSTGKLASFDLPALAAALRPERDGIFQFLGLQTLYDRYFLHTDGVRFELPQAFFMRVAMGLAAREIDRDARAIEFYELLVVVRFHVLHADAFQRGNVASAAVLVLPHNDSMTISTESSRRSRTMRCSRNTRVGSATTGHAYAGLARTSPAPMDNPKASYHSSRWRTTRRSPSTREGSAKGRCAVIWKRGTSTSKSSWTCARTLAMIVVELTT